MPRSAKTTVAALAAAGFFTVAPVTALTPLAFADTSGNGSVGSGNQIDVDVEAPVNVCGNAVAVLGLAGASCEDATATSGTAPTPTPTATPGDCEDPGADHAGYCEDETTPEKPEEPAVPEQPEPEQPVPSPDDQTDKDEPGTQPQPGYEEDHDVPAATPSETVGADAVAADSPAEVNKAGASELPVTGSNLMALIAVALTAVVSGIGVVLLSRRRSSATK